MIAPAAALLLAVISTPDASHDDIEVAFAVRQDWRAGFVGEVTVINHTAEPVRDWTLEAKFPFQIHGAWGVEFTKRDDMMVFRPPPWNRELRAHGGSLVFGFTAQPGYPAIPLQVRFNDREIPLQNWSPGLVQPPPGTPRPAPVQLPLLESTRDSATWGDEETRIQAKIPSDWNEAATLEFEIENRTGVIWRDWAIAVGLPGNIQSAWNTKTSRTPEGLLEFDAGKEDWNRDIAPGDSAQFGFQLAPGGLDQWPETVTVFGLPGERPPPPDLDLPPRKIEERIAKRPTPPPAPKPTPPAPPTIPTPMPDAPDYARALDLSLLFYEAQRSGRLPENNRIPWRGDSALNDGADAGVDLTGGYYDAGDHVKFTFPMAASMTMLAWGGVEYRHEYEALGAINDLLDAVGWGTDWLLKASAAPGFLCAQVGDAFLDHSIWAPPETMTMRRPSFWIDANRPGSDLAGEVAAALASSSILFRPYDPVYAAVLLDRAKELYEFARNHRGRYSDSVPQVRMFYNSFSGDADELAWAALWLYRATEDDRYLTEARDIWHRELAGRRLQWTQTWDDKTPGVVLLLAMLTGESSFRERLDEWLDFWTKGSRGAQIQTTPGGLAWLDQWGSLRYAINTSFLALVTSDFLGDPDGEYLRFAQRQVNYVLGENPQHFSYLIGFGERFPRNPHHRASHGSTTGSIHDPPVNRHILQGALVGGPPRPEDDSYRDDREDYQSNEVSLDYNATLPGCLVRLAGGNPQE